MKTEEYVEKIDGLIKYVWSKAPPPLIALHLTLDNSFFQKYPECIVRTPYGYVYYTYNPATHNFGASLLTKDHWSSLSAESHVDIASKDIAHIAYEYCKALAIGKIHEENGPMLTSRLQSIQNEMEEMLLEEKLQSNG